jgi:hypothetical protein
LVNSISLVPGIRGVLGYGHDDLTIEGS